MPFNITIPQIGKKKGVKDCIISILSNEWPLTGKKIYNIIRKQYELPVTYQAVHKTLKKLIEDEVLVKTGKDYKLNEEWIQQLKEFGSKLETSYSNKQEIPSAESIFSKQYTSFSVSTVTDLYGFIIDVLDYTKRNNIKEVVANTFHPWNPMLTTESQLRIVKDFINKVNFYGIAKYSMPMDKALKTFYEKTGSKIKIKLGIPDCVSDCETMVIEDRIFQFYYPKELVNNINSIYSRLSSLNDIDFVELHKNFYFKKSRINVLVNKNQEIADSIRNDTLKYFDKKL